LRIIWISPEYAGKLAVEAIDDKVMRDFIPWRRDYYADFKKLPIRAVFKKLASLNIDGKAMSS
jgi:hypothetical protein